MSTFRGHSIQIGSFEKVWGFGVAREKVVTMVIGKDDDDIGFFRTQRCANEDWQKKAGHGARVKDCCDYCNSE